MRFAQGTEAEGVVEQSQGRAAQVQGSGSGSGASTDSTQHTVTCTCMHTHTCMRMHPPLCAGSPDVGIVVQALQCGHHAVKRGLRDARVQRACSDGAWAGGRELGMHTEQVLQRRLRSICTPPIALPTTHPPLYTPTCDEEQVRLLQQLHMHACEAVEEGLGEALAPAALLQAAFRAQVGG